MKRFYMLSGATANPKDRGKYHASYNECHKLSCRRIRGEQYYKEVDLDRNRMN